LKDLIAEKRGLLKRARSVQKDQEARDFLKGLDGSHSSTEAGGRSSRSVDGFGASDSDEFVLQTDQERGDPTVQSSISDPVTLLERLESEKVESSVSNGGRCDVQKVKMLERELKENEQIHRTCFDDLASEYDALKRKLDLLEEERKQEKQEVRIQMDELE
jgi:hypothetical protein